MAITDKHIQLQQERQQTAEQIADLLEEVRMVCSKVPRRIVDADLHTTERWKQLAEKWYAKSLQGISTYAKSLPQLEDIKGEISEAVNLLSGRTPFPQERRR